MIFRLDFYGNPIAEPSLLNPGAAPADSAPTGDWFLVVTSVPTGVNANVVAALIASNLTIPVPFTVGGVATAIRFQCSYAAILAGATIATRW